MAWFPGMLLVPQSLDGILAGCFRGRQGAGNKSDEHDDSHDGGDGCRCKLQDIQAGKSRQHRCREEGADRSTDTDGNEGSDGAAQEADEDSFEAEECVGCSLALAHAHCFHEADFASALLNVHEQGVNDAEPRGQSLSSVDSASLSRTTGR